MIRTTTCPTDADFHSLLSGRTPPPQTDSVSDHLGGCPDCAARIARFLEKDDLFDCLLAQKAAVGVDPVFDVERMINRLSGEHSGATVGLGNVLAGPSDDRAGPALVQTQSRPQSDDPKLARMQVTLTVTAGPHVGREFSFDSHDTFLVGRTKKAHFYLAEKDKYFSRIHFLVEVNPPMCRLLDVGSRNGTFVNGQRVVEINLNDQDEIRAGHTLLKVSVEKIARDSTIAAQPSEPSLLVESIRSECQSAAQPSRIAGYRIVKELGRGGMGVVFEAVCENDGTTVAVKTIVPALAGNRSLVDKFLREANILRELDHPRIVRFREIGEASGTIFFAMDYVPGTDAAKVLQEQGALPIKMAVRLIAQVLEALEYAHAKGFVHRDLKPANILIESRDGKRSVKVADFGLARVYNASQLSGLTLTGDIGGTVDYMPPEQVANFRDVQPTADQFSTAATLYRLLTNQPLYSSEKPVHPLMLVLLGAVVPIRQRRPDVPKGLATAIKRALSRDPAARFKDAALFREALVPYGR